MPTPKKTAVPPSVAPTPAAPMVQPSSERRTKQAPSMSHERIAADIAAFRKAGGKVEVLGNTPVLRNASPAKGSAATARPGDATPVLARR